MLKLWISFLYVSMSQPFFFFIILPDHLSKYFSPYPWHLFMDTYSMTFITTTEYTPHLFICIAVLERLQTIVIPKSFGPFPWPHFYLLGSTVDLVEGARMPSVTNCNSFLIEHQTKRVSAEPRVGIFGSISQLHNLTAVWSWKINSIFLSFLNLK